MDTDTKTMKRCREQFRRNRAFLTLLSGFYRLFPIRTRIKLLERHRYMRGKLGLGLRYALLRSVALRCGDNVGVHQGVFLCNPQNLSVGENVSLQPMCYLECGLSAQEGLEIGNDVSIAHGATIMATTHTYADKDVNIKDQPVCSRRTVIRDNVWIGAKATVLAGCTVARGCVIGAGAVVTKSTEENAVYAGVPARMLKQR